MANKILPVADALKQLYEALGGDDPEVLELSTNTELIQEIAKVASSGGSGLPEVTEADDGRVLGVDDGEWKAVEPASVPPIYLISFEGSAVNEATISGNYDDAVALLDSGKPIGFLRQHIFLSSAGVEGEDVVADLSWAYDLTSKIITIYFENNTKGWTWGPYGLEYFAS